MNLSLIVWCTLAGIWLLRADCFAAPDFVRPTFHNRPLLHGYVIEDLVGEDDENLELNKRQQFDDYGHMRFGKRDRFDDYGHLRFGRNHQ